MSEEMNFTPNPGKNLIRAVDGVDYMRIPVKTHLITKDDDMADVVKKYPQDLMREGDILFISEKAVACTQCRAIPMEDIKPRKLAVTLSRYVTKTPAGIGLGIPETMEMALQECGTLRIRPMTTMWSSLRPTPWGRPRVWRRPLDTQWPSWTSTTWGPIF